MLRRKIIQWNISKVDCKTVVFFASVCQTNARGLWTKGLERVWKRRVELARELRALRPAIWRKLNDCFAVYFKGTRAKLQNTPERNYIFKYFVHIVIHSEHPVCASSLTTYSNQY